MRNNIFRLFGFALASSSLIGCNAGLGKQSQAITNDTQVKIGQNNSSLRLGSGVYQPTGVVGPTICMKDASNPNSFKTPHGNLSLGTQVSTKLLHENLNLAVGGKVGFGTFGASASANFVRDVQDDNYTRNFTYLQDFGWNADFEAQDFGNDNLTTTAQKAYASGIKQFLNYCGDSYVSSASAGSLLVVNVKIEFASYQDKQTFNAKMGAKFGIGNITSTIKSSKLDQSMNASISVEALQLGGDPSKLSSIFTKSSTGDYYVAQCSFKDLNSCNQIINGVLAYSQTIEVQVKDSNDNPIKDKLFYYNPTITNYADVGIDLATQIPSREVVTAQAQLQSMVELINEDLTFVKHYQKSAVARYFDVEMSNFLKSAEKALSMRQDYLLSHGFDCYTSKEIANCPKLVTEASDVFNNVNEYKVDQSKMEYVKTGMAQVNSKGEKTFLAPINLSKKYYNINLSALNVNVTITSLDPKIMTTYGVWNSGADKCKLSSNNGVYYFGSCSDERSMSYEFINNVM